MQSDLGFRVRLRVRVGIRLGCDEPTFKVEIGERQVTISSQSKDEAIKEAEWIILSARGFSTYDDAKNFGEQLKRIFQITTLSTRVGSNIGNDKSTSSIHEGFARSIGLLTPEQRLMPNVHGLSVIPDDDLSRFPNLSARGSVTSSPSQFAETLQEVASAMPIKLSAAEPGLGLLNAALMVAQPLSQIVIAFSAIEALAQSEDWTSTQKRKIKELADALDDGSIGEDLETKEIADALRRSIHRIGVRQGVLRVLKKLELNKLKPEWDRLYGMRSKIFHGVSQTEEHELNELALDVVRLCGCILFKLIELEGVPMPSIAKAHYELST